MRALFDPGGYVFWLLVASILVFALERLRPWRPSQRVLRRGIAQDGFWLVFNGHAAALLIAIPAAWASSHVDALFVALRLPALAMVGALAGAPLAAQLAVVLIGKDFLDWCVHRLLHRVPWLWEFHKVHHSIEELDWIGSFRFHWMEIVVYRSLTYLPLVVLGIDGRVLLANAVIGTLVGHLNHANLRLDWGPLRYVVNSPRFHAWHHDRLPAKGRGTNFAIVFSAWDWLFGTAHYPRDVEQPASLGFDGDERFPSSLVARLFHPVSTWLLPVAPIGGTESLRPPKPTRAEDTLP